MGRLSYFLIIVLVILGLSSTLLQGRGVLTERSLASDLASSDGQALRLPAIDAIKKASQSSYVEPEQLIRFAAQLWRLAISEEVPEKRLEYFCVVLATYGRALRQRPYSGEMLARWAELRQLLGNVNCLDPNTVGDVEKVLEEALRSDPRNPDLLFRVANTYFAREEHDKALEAQKRYLVFETSPSRQRLDIVESRFRSAQEVLQGVPAQFPQIIEWSSRLLPRAEEFPGLRSVLSQLQEQAFAALQESYRNGSISTVLYQRQLGQLLAVTSSSEVRQSIDTSLGKRLSAQGSVGEGDYLIFRSQFKDLQFLVVSLTSDLRPEKSPLYGWEKDGTVYMDDHYQSVGFFLGPQQTVKTIELTTQRQVSSLDISRLAVFVSEDNEQWIDISTDIRSEQVRIAGKRSIVLLPPSGTYRYWKIHFLGGERTQKFGGTLKTLLRVYGLSGKN